MGIPSYFRRILQKYPGCLTKQAPQNVGALCFDFNCLIYRCIRAPGIPPVPDQVEQPEEFHAWEAMVLKEVGKTVKEVWKTSGSPKKVYMAVDGVVPMAKIRQQRVRRFKSSWLRKTLGGSGSSWDTNAITPGTGFMKKLTTELKGLAKDYGWILSSWDEPGEGEHKVMALIRDGCLGVAKDKPIIVYGLDADLILLSLLVGEQTGRPLWLLREKQEFGGAPVQNHAGEQEYTFFNLPEFKDRLGVKGENEMLNYLCLMSFMGNDFLPHSVTHKLNDDGYEYVLEEYKNLVRGKKWLVEDGKMNLNVAKEIWSRWALDEKDKFYHMIQKKKDQSKRGVGKGMDPSEGLPLEWMVEKDYLKDGVLLEDWRELYKKNYGETACLEYVKGCQWILDYYCGKPVDLDWMFPAWVPPLWSELAGVPDVDQGPQSKGTVIRPEEQLAMVLPLESWGLLEDRGLRRLPALAPQFWPEKFEFFSLGRKWLWECEARVPCLTAVRLREILKSNV